MKIKRERKKTLSKLNWFYAFSWLCVVKCNARTHQQKYNNQNISKNSFEVILFSCHKRKSMCVCSLWLRIHVIEFEHLKRTSIYLNSSQILQLIFFLPDLCRIRPFSLAFKSIFITHSKRCMVLFFSFISQLQHLVSQMYPFNLWNAYRKRFFGIYLLYFRYAFDFYYSVGFVWDFSLWFFLPWHFEWPEHWF